MWEWIEQMREQVCDLERRVRLAKANVEQISTTMAAWSQAPLYQRKEDKKDCLLGLEVSYPPTSTFCSCSRACHFYEFLLCPCRTVPTIVRHGMDVLHLTVTKYMLLLLRTWSFFRCSFPFFINFVCINVHVYI